MNFTPEQRLLIAEYIHGYHTDTLLKNNAIGVIKLLTSCGLIDNFTYELLLLEVREDKNNVGTKIALLLVEVIPEEVRTKILNEYYGT